MTIPNIRNHSYAGTMLTWEQASQVVPVMSVDDVAKALHVDVAILVKDFTHSGDGFNFVHQSDSGEACFEFDSLWDYLRDDCPFDGAKELFAELFLCEH